MAGWIERPSMRRQATSGARQRRDWLLPAGAAAALHVALLVAIAGIPDQPMPEDAVSPAQAVTLILVQPGIEALPAAAPLSPTTAGPIPPALPAEPAPPGQPPPPREPPADQTPAVAPPQPQSEEPQLPLSPQQRLEQPPRLEQLSPSPEPMSEQPPPSQSKLEQEFPPAPIPHPALEQPPPEQPLAPRQPPLLEQPPAPPAGRKAVPRLPVVQPRPAAVPPRAEPAAGTRPPASPAAAHSAAPNPNALGAYRDSLADHVRAYQRYPALARSRHEEGLVVVRVTIQRDGRIAATSIEQGSGYDRLDREALATLARADPLPAVPAAVAGQTIDLTFPLRFHLE